MFKEYRISELGNVVGGGTPSTVADDYWNGDIPWITPKDLTGYTSVYISYGETFITKQGLNKSAAKLLPKNTVLFSSRAPIGYVALAKNPICTNQGFKSIICDETKVYPLYFYYYLKTNLDYIKLFGSGATFPEISGNTMKNIKVNIIENIEQQQKIASILSAYDDLIENNNKRIKILEQMAENLYKEWFVRFRFPNYQNTEFENGIPKGWKVIQVQDLFDISIGRTPDRKVFEYFSNNQSDYLWISIADMKDKMFVMSSAEYLTCDAIRKVNMPMVSENTVILSFKLSVGRVAITTQLSCTNEAIAHFNTNNKQLVEYTYLYLKFFQYQDLGNTSAIGNAVNSTIIRKMKFLYPDEEIVRVFHLQIKDVFNEIKLLSRKNQNLIKQRDMLLPRLMSGKLEVRHG